MPLPDIPLSAEARSLFERIKPQIDGHLAEVNRTPVSVLIWGPSVDSSHPLGAVRGRLRMALRSNGHAAFFSEELCDSTSSHSIRLQQIAQAREFDLIVSMPCTPGSIAEAHDFAADRRIHAKLLLFLNREHLDGYSAQSLQALKSVVSCQLEYYDNILDFSIIETMTLAEVQKIREMKYILAGRY